MTIDTGKQAAIELSEEATANFLAHLQKAIEKAEMDEYPLAIILFRERDAEFIYPSEQNQKSILMEAIQVFREATGATGPILMHSYQSLGLIQAKCDTTRATEMMDSAVHALSRHVFLREGQKYQTQFEFGVALYPSDAVKAVELLDKASSGLSDLLPKDR